MEKTIKTGDFVRLTDPLDNGTIVRIENVNGNGLASWLGGAQNCDMEQIKANVQIGDCSYYISLSSIIGAIEQGFETDGFHIKLYPESAVEYWKHRAEVAEQGNALNEKLLKEEHNKLLNVQDNIEKLQSGLSRCRAKNAAYLREKKQAENVYYLQVSQVATV